MLTTRSPIASPATAQRTALVAGRSSLIRVGISALLSDFEINVISEAREPDELSGKAMGHRPDLIVLCDTQSSSDSIDFLEALADLPRALQSSTHSSSYLVVTNRVDAYGASRVMTKFSGGFGYVLLDKVQAVEDFRLIVSRVILGDSVVDPDVVYAMLGQRFRDDRFSNLTKREAQAMALMAAGLTNRAIATEMIITTRAAEKHVGSIFEKLDLDPAPDNHRRVLAVLQFLQAR